MPPVIDSEKCKKCGICAAVCPTDVYWGTGPRDVPSPRYPEECWHCNACVHDCPEGAIRLRIPLPMQVVYK